MDYRHIDEKEPKTIEDILFNIKIVSPNHYKKLI